MNPCHAKKCACCLEGHGFFWANILSKFGFNCEVWRSKVCLYLAISSASWLIRRKENIYVVWIFMFLSPLLGDRISFWFSLFIAAVYNIKGKLEERYCNIASIWWVQDQLNAPGTAATTVSACCMFHAMCCLESKMDWPHREGARCPRQIQINYQIWECLMEPNPHSRTCWGALLLTHSAKLTNYPQRALNSLCN